MDFHSDGKVNYSEFLAATISTINFNKEEKLWSAFKYFDTTDSGVITLDSVIDALKDSGVIIDEEGLKNIFNELQKKGKKINFNEFKAIALGKEVVEEESEFTKDLRDLKETEGDIKNKINLKLNFKENDINNFNCETKENNNNNVDFIKKTETAFIKEEKKESQDIFFEKVNFSTNNINNENIDSKKYIYNNESGFHADNNLTENKKSDNKEEPKNEKDDKNKSESNNNSGGNTNKNVINSSNNNRHAIKRNNKSSRSNNKSSKSNNKSSKSNNKSSKSNMEVLIEEKSIDNNDKFTEVNEMQE